MRVYIDSSVFLHLLLEGKRADEAAAILSGVEAGDIVGFISPLVVDEVVFKILYTRALELGAKGFYEFREKYGKDEKFREKCFEAVSRFRRYLDSLSGLRWVGIGEVDVLQAMEISGKYGLLPSDSLHAAVALRLGVPIATFDRDFSRVPGLSVVP